MIATECPELMDRFLQLAGGSESAGVRGARDIALVMTA